MEIHRITLGRRTYLEIRNRAPMFGKGITPCPWFCGSKAKGSGSKKPIYCEGYLVGKRREDQATVVESQLCPQCGSAIQFGEGQNKAVCAYCGTTVVRSSASGGNPVEKELAAEKLIQEMVGRERRLRSQGRPAPAKILTAQTTDIFRDAVEGRGVVMSFTVEVQPDGEDAFNAATETLVGLVAVNHYHPGTVLDVRYDPQDHAQVSIEGRHGVPESNPEEQERQMEAQSQAATAVVEVPTPARCKPHAAGKVPVPDQFDPVTHLGEATAVYRHQGTMLFAALSGTKPKELVLYQDGVAFQKGGKEIHIWRWAEVAAILTRITRGIMHEYTLLKDSGEKLILDDDLGFVEIENLIEPIKDAVYTLLYPPLAQHYDAGQAVAFGPVTVHRENGLKMGGKTYASTDIIEVKVDQGQFMVMTHDDHKHEVRTCEIPNVELLCRLIGVELQQTQLWTH